MDIDPSIFLPAAATSPSPAPDPPDPPDHKNKISQETRLATKRRSTSLVDDFSVSLSKKTSSSDLSIPSIQTIYQHPVLVIGVKEYSNSDKGPFILHVSRTVPDPSAGTSIRPIKFGQFLKNHKIKNICCDGVKSVGRNRISVEFKSASDANIFLDSEILSACNYTATIPTFNITRMGLVRNVPVDMSLDEFAESLEVPEGCGFVLKARRLNRKTIMEDGKVSWLPTQTVVLTFRGQRLPDRIFSFHTSLSVEPYQLPTIMCMNCCRFGHVKLQCRSKPRCFKCAKDHRGDSCDVVENNSTCIHCSGNHFASNRTCPELDRQKNIKNLMTKNGISYQEASLNFPRSVRSFAEVSQSIFSPLSPPSQASVPSSAPTSRSYVKTVFTPPRPRSPLGKSFDRSSHYSIISSPSSSGNGLAFSQSQTSNQNDNRQSFLIETLISLIIELFSSSNSHLPPNVAHKLSQIITSSPNHEPSVHSPVECQKSSPSEG